MKAFREPSFIYSCLVQAKFLRICLSQQWNGLSCRKPIWWKKKIKLKKSQQILKQKCRGGRGGRKLTRQLEKEVYCKIMQEPRNKISYSTTCEGTYLHYSWSINYTTLNVFFESLPLKLNTCSRQPNSTLLSLPSPSPQHSLFNFVLLPNYDNYFLILPFYFLLPALSEPAVTALMF